MLEYDFHVVDSTVAGHASDSLLHMCRVVEVNIIGEVMDSNPLDRFSALPTSAYWGEFLTLGVELRVAIHASFGCGDRGVLRVFDCGVAVATVDCQLAGV